jgi:hypothetical protein
MATQLKIGSSYNFYSKYNSILAKKVKVVAIMTYEEASNQTFDMMTLAINERVISVKDEDLKAEIGNDNIYLLRELNPSADGSYNEYIVWDSIINFDKTIALDEEYISTLSIKVNSTTDFGILQIVNTIKNAIQTTYGNSVSINITTPVTIANDETKEETSTTLTDARLKKAESIIDTLNSFEAKLVPAAQQIIASNIQTNIQSIGNDLNTISNEISLMKRRL